MVWIDTVSTLLFAIGSFVSLLVAVVASVRWVVRREMQPVRGEVESLSDRFDYWTGEHQRLHTDERRAVASAFERSGLHPPDGWRAGTRGDNNQSVPDH